MPSREYLMLVKESSFGTKMAAPTAGTDAIYMRLSGANAFTMQSVPIIEDIPYGGGRATPACAYSDQETCTGQLSGELYPAQAELLLSWALGLVNTGRTAPWVTTDSAGVMPPGDLASCSIFHAIQRSDSTYDLRQYSGVKVLSGGIQAARDQPAARFSFQLQGIKDAVVTALEFPAPAETDYPCGPYLFSHTAGELKIASARSQYASVAFNFQNAMAPQWFESKYLTLNKFCGRTCSLDVALHMKPSPDDLATLKALTASAASLKFDNQAYSFKIDLGAKNRFKTLTRDLPLNNVYMWNGSVQNYFDPSAGTDLSLTFTSPGP